MKQGDLVKLSEGCIEQCNISPEWAKQVGVITKVVPGRSESSIKGMFGYKVAWSDGITVEDKWDLEIVSEAR